MDVATGVPVAFADVALLDEDGVLIATTIGDHSGRFVIRAPEAGHYYCTIYRIGYQEMRSPLLAIPAEGRYEIDFTLHPDPISLEGLLVTVEDKTAVNWLRRELLESPHAMSGFRLLRGRRLEEAKSKSKDNTDMLRWLYIPVSHGREVCVLIFLEGCGQLYVDGRWLPNEHIDQIEMSSVVAVMTVRGGGARVYLFTRDFDWLTHWND